MEKRTNETPGESDGSSDSIFREYYTPVPFVDRFAASPAGAVDVIIPVIHTNELWKANLFSLYREIPIHKLLIGDGGCVDDSIDIVKEFPRVEILDHRAYKSLGYSLRKLIEAVETVWFIYVHSDVYLPPGWFDTMQGHQKKYDWFGCPMRHTVMVEYEIPEKVRPYAGSQMGRKSAFLPRLETIDDDYVYRQEDFVLVDLIENAGFKHGKIEDTFHYHQTMYKPSRWGRKVNAVKIETELTPDEEVRTWMMQGKGIIKYLQPTNEYVTYNVPFSVNRLLELGELNSSNWPEFQRWVQETNPAWLPYLPKRKGIKSRIRGLLTKALRRFGD